MSPSADDSRAEALERLDAVEREIAQLEESVRAASGRLRGEVARARAAVHDLHASALAPPPLAPAVAEPAAGGATGLSPTTARASSPSTRAARGAAGGRRTRPGGEFPGGRRRAPA